MKGLIAALAVWCALAEAAAGQSPPEALVWMALRDINEVHFNREAPTNRPPLVTELPEGMIQAVDVSQDGRPDWLIDYSAAESAAFCGTGGCQKLLYVSDGEDDHVLAFDQQALGLSFAGPVVRAWVHHTYCPGDGMDCRLSFVWDRANRRLVRRGMPPGSEPPGSFQPRKPRD